MDHKIKPLASNNTQILLTPENCGHDILTQLSYFVTNEVRMPAGLVVSVIEEIERLRTERDEWQAEYHKAFSELGLAADEIERLRTALALACGELSGYGPHTNSSPDHLMQELLEEARRG